GCIDPSHCSAFQNKSCLHMCLTFLCPSCSESVCMFPESQVPPLPPEPARFHIPDSTPLFRQEVCRSSLPPLRKASVCSAVFSLRPDAPCDSCGRLWWWSL